MPQVLIIDTAGGPRALFRTALECFSFEVVEADDGETGAALYARLRPNVVVCDLALAGLDGIDTTRRLLDLDPGARVVLVTDPIAGEVDRRSAAEFFGVAVVLDRPFGVDDLVGAVEAALASNAFPLSGDEDGDPVVACRGVTLDFELAQADRRRAAGRELAQASGSPHALAC